jgi:hypothetical protein
MNCIQIVDWGKHYENNRTRELRKVSWVPVPNKMDGDGYTTLLSHPDGAAHFGAWCALLQVASRCNLGSIPHDDAGKYRDSAKYDSSPFPFGRGILIRDNGEAHDAQSLERITRIPSSVWKEALPRLLSIGWIKECDLGTISALSRQGIGTHRRDAADRVPNEMKGNVMKGGRGTTPPSQASPSEPQEKESSTKADNRIPEEITPMMFELQEIHRKAARGAELKLTDGEMGDLLALFRQHDGPSVIAAYRLHQAEKPGRAFCFFLKDFAEYFARAPKPAGPPPPHCAYCGADGAHTASCNRPGNPNGLASPAPDTFDDSFPEASS